MAGAKSIIFYGSYVLFKRSKYRKWRHGGQVAKLVRLSPVCFPHNGYILIAAPVIVIVVVAMQEGMLVGRSNSKLTAIV